LKKFLYRRRQVSKEIHAPSERTSYEISEPVIDAHIFYKEEVRGNNSEGGIDKAAGKFKRQIRWKRRRQNKII
jgi:hypothetical protein